MAKPVVRTIHLMQASMRFDQTDAQKLEDITYIKNQNPHLVGMTETSSFKDLIRANRGDYRVIAQPKSENTILVREDVKFIKHARQYVHLDNWHNRPVYIDWVVVNFHGEIITFHEVHWNAGIADEINNKTISPHMLQHRKTTRAMATLVKKHAEGHKISFFAGDINVDEHNDNTSGNENFPHHIFKQNGLLTIWDEKRVSPQAWTHRGGRLIDVIGSYNRDTRVAADRYKIHPKQNSDHRFVSAWYDITALTKATGGGVTPAPAPTPSDKGEDMRDWTDYLGDQETYYLPRATDDSDGHTHG